MLCRASARCRLRLGAGAAPGGLALSPARVDLFTTHTYL